jgi:hypothetical protein
MTLRVRPVIRVLVAKQVCSKPGPGHDSSSCNESGQKAMHYRQLSAYELLRQCQLGHDVMLQLLALAAQRTGLPVCCQ